MSSCRISIHLMLLFIEIIGFRPHSLVSFQYISCYCLSTIPSCPSNGVPYFNTSHVTVYLCACFYEQVIIIISIHLMLLFIAVRFWGLQFFLYFNTSHVTVYLCSKSTESIRTGISIHLMLLFITMLIITTKVFRYFNTSHVTVYLILSASYFSLSLFQYISCYCLSQFREDLTIKPLISIHLMLLFISLTATLLTFVT